MPTPMGGFLPQCVSLESGGGPGPVGHLRIRPPDPWLAYSPATSKCASGNQCPGKAENRGLTRDEPVPYDGVPGGRMPVQPATSRPVPHGGVPGSGPCGQTRDELPGPSRRGVWKRAVRSDP